MAEWTRLPAWYAVALGGGILIYFGLRQEPDGAWQWLFWPLLGAAALLRGARPFTAAALALAGVAALGFAAAAWHAGRAAPVPELPTRAVELSGVVSAVDLLPNGRRLTLTGARLGEGAQPLERQLRLRLRANDPARPEPGDLVRVRALVRPPSPPPAPGGWDFQRAAFFSGLAGSGFAIGAAEVTAGPGAGPDRFAALRALLESRVIAVLPGAAGAVSAALLTGSQSGIPAEAIAAMRDSGLAHLLSPSGLHVAVAVGIGFAAVRLLLAASSALARRGDGKLAASLAGLMLGGGYTLLTGLQVPMLRSFAMAAVGTLALATGRRVLSVRALALAAAAVLLWQPDAVLGPSFQMSFAAVLALIAAWDALRPATERLRGEGQAWRRVMVSSAALLATSLIAGATTMPFGLHHFGRVQFYGVVANAVAVPITSLLVMPAGLAAVALMPLRLEWLALAPMGWGVEAVLWVARVVAAWPGAAPNVPPIPAWGLLVFAVGLCWLCLWRLRWRLLGVPVMALGLASGAWADPPDLLVSGDGRLIAARVPGGAFVERASGGSTFTRDAWLRGWGEDAAPAMPREGVAAGGALRCDPARCLIRPHPEDAAAVLLRAAPAARGARPPPVQAGNGCGDGAVLISAEPIRGRCDGAAIVDRFSVWRDGPHAVWLDRDGARVLSDRADRGDRPWVPPRPRPRTPAGAGPEAARDGAAVD